MIFKIFFFSLAIFIIIVIILISNPKLLLKVLHLFSDKQKTQKEYKKDITIEKKQEKGNEDFSDYEEIKDSEA